MFRWMCRWMFRWMDRLSVGWIFRWMFRRVCRWMFRWMVRWMFGIMGTRARGVWKVAYASFRLLEGTSPRQRCCCSVYKANALLVLYLCSRSFYRSSPTKIETETEIEAETNLAESSTETELKSPKEIETKEDAETEADIIRNLTRNQTPNESLVESDSWN